MDTERDAVSRAVEAVWRIESGRLTAILARITGDVGLAEDMAQEALAAALQTWPANGIPPNPAGWLITTAKNRLIDAQRREVNLKSKTATMGRDAEPVPGPDSEESIDQLDDYLDDDILRLLFTACHPALSLESRVALTLKCVGGLSTDEIARAFLVPETTAAQRIVRAKKTLKDKNVGFELPTAEEASERLASVLEVIYLIFNEGYSATSGSDWVRPALCEDALRLGRVLTARADQEPEVHGLVALMELQASRLPARVGAQGEAILLPDQDRRLWDRLLIRRGLASLSRAEGLPRPLGPYAIQAGIAACHARAATAEETDWSRIVLLYELLGKLWQSPIVELNRAVAVGYATGPGAGLAIVDVIARGGALSTYPQLHAVRGDLLARLGRRTDSAEAFGHAAALSNNETESAMFAARAKKS